MPKDNSLKHPTPKSTSNLTPPKSTSNLTVYGQIKPGHKQRNKKNNQINKSKNQKDRKIINYDQLQSRKRKENVNNFAL